MVIGGNMLREGMFIAERYEIIEKIGSGGMSDVYKAKCHKLNRFVAINRMNRANLKATIYLCCACKVLR